MIILIASFLLFILFCVVFHIIVTKRTKRFNNKLLADCNMYDASNLKIKKK